MTKNLNSFYMALLLTVTFAAHAEIQLGQDKVKLLEKCQIELHELKTPSNKHLSTTFSTMESVT